MNAAQVLETCADFMKRFGNCRFQWLSISVTEVPIDLSLLRAGNPACCLFRVPAFAGTTQTNKSGLP